MKHELFDEFNNVCQPVMNFLQKYYPEEWPDKKYIIITNDNTQFLSRETNLRNLKQEEIMNKIAEMSK